MNTPHRPSEAAESRSSKVMSATRLARAGLLAVLGTIGAAGSAKAVDGCTVLLCLTTPSWRAIAQCVPPVRQVLRDLALGKPFPTCAMAGSGNTASHSWSVAPDFCPPQYTRSYDGPNGVIYTCDFTGAISVTVLGIPFSRTWWSTDGDAVTEFSEAAKAQLGAWDRRFDDDYTSWKNSRPSSVDPQN